jgi:uncharacterized protein YkwD
MQRATTTPREASLRTTAAGLAALACVAAPAAHAQASLPASVVRACPNADALPGTVPTRALGTATVCLVNRVRAGRGLARLRVNRHLNRFATAFTRRMVSRRFFSHDVPGGPSFSQRANSSAYARSAGRMTMGENLAWGTAELATPAAIVEAWLRSPGHRDNVLRPRFREIGVGVLEAAPEVGWEGSSPVTYVHAFGWRARR